MSKFNHMYSRNLKLAAILALVCVCAQPAMGQQAPVASPAKESQPQPEEKSIQVFRLEYADAETLAGVIAQIVGGLNVAFDKLSNSIVVSGTRNNLKFAEALALRLDSRDIIERAHFSPVSVRVVWLVEGDDSAAAPANDLKGVLVELNRMGLKQLGQVAQAVVRSQEEGTFQISCSPLLENKPTMLSANGRISAREGLQIHISATRRGAPEAAAADKPARLGAAETTEKLIDLNVNTVFSTNDYIVLAVAPIGKITSVFVIQITKNNP